MSTPFQFVRTCHVQNVDDEGRDVVHVKGYAHDGDKVTPQIQTIVAPKRSFWITKPGCRTYNETKEWEEFANLDQYVCHNYDMPNQIFKALHGYYPKKSINPRKLYDNPYIYGAAISIESLIAHKFIDDFQQSGCRPTKITTGFFDTEISIVPGREGEFIVGTISHENKIYTAIHKASYFRVVDGKREHLDDLRFVEDLSRTTFQNLITQHGFEFHYYLAEDGVDALRWLMLQANQNHTDFIGIWNLAYDVSQVIRICEEHGVDPKTIVSHPDIAPEHQLFKYVPDKSKDVSHFTEVWNWVHMSASFQFYDAMCLYSILRIASGKEWSYKLDDILEKNIQRKKLKFSHLVDPDSMSSADWHRTMELNHPLEYIVYNQFDVIGLQLMEWQNTDAQNMQQLAGWTALSKYARQTIRGTDALYFTCLKRKRVLGTPGSTMRMETDALLGPAIGGTVLAAHRVDGVGEPIIEEYPDRETNVSINVFDIDLSSLYPSLTMALNLSRETKLSTLVTIGDLSHEVSTNIHDYMVAPIENAHRLGREFFNLPGYHDIAQAYEAFLVQKE